MRRTLPPVATETELVDAFRALAKAAPDATDFTFQRGDVQLRVRHFPGSSAHLLITTPYRGRDLAADEGYRGEAGSKAVARPMGIELRAELATDVAAKADGVAVEAQLGDTDFDDAVYVETASPPDVCRHVLGSPKARASATALLSAGATTVVLDGEGGEVVLRLDRFAALSPSAAGLAEHFVTLAEHLPQVHASGEAAPVDPFYRALVATAVASGIGTLPMGLCIALALAHCEACVACDGCRQPLELAAAGGMALGLLTSVVVRQRVRATSSAHRHRPLIMFFVALLAMELAMVLGYVATLVVTP